MQQFNPRRFQAVVMGLVLVGTLNGSTPVEAQAADAAEGQRSFLVFDATLYKNKPALSGYSLKPIKLLYESRLFPKGHQPQALPPEQAVRSIAKELRGTSEPVIVDIERWPLKGDATVVKESVGKLSSILSWIKAEAPDIHLGAYGTVPVRDYWRAVRGPGSKEYQAWQRDNDRLEELATWQDALYPSLYTFYPDRQGWVAYAIAQLAEAKRKSNGKPVYAFLWPQYHESNATLRLQPIEADYWELQLNTVRQHADGLIIWGGWGDHGPEPWNEEAPWWQVTKRFMQTLSTGQLKGPSQLAIQ